MRLLLLGGGHAHVQVLQAFAQRPVPGLELTLLTPYAQQVYSGMVPGVLAGHYRLDEALISLLPLAREAGARWLEDAAVGIDTQSRWVRTAQGTTVPYDVLAVDTGGVMQPDRLPGAQAHALFVRPMERFVQQLPGLIQRAAQGPLRVAVLGGGAAGVELAMALRFRLDAIAAVDTRVTLLTGGPEPLANYTPGVQRRVQGAMADLRVEVLQARCIAIESSRLQLHDGTWLACDACIVATGAQAPAWLQGSPLALDANGFLLTGPTLQSVSHPDVFAAGDVATRADAPHAKSGVYAVRAGPPLAANLRAFIEGRVMQPHTPQRRTLNLMACGGRSAVASWGPWSAQGAWVWRWKDHIDRAFMARFQRA